MNKIVIYFPEMPRSKISDLLGIIKGAQSVTNALIKHQEDAIKYTITHSSLKTLPEKYIQAARKRLSDIEPSKVPVSLSRIKIVQLLSIFYVYRL